MAQKKILLAAESIEVPPLLSPFKPFEVKESARKSKAIILPPVADTATTAPEGSTAGGLVDELTKICRHLDIIEVDQKIILAPLEKTV